MKFNLYVSCRLGERLFFIGWDAIRGEAWATPSTSIRDTVDQTVETIAHTVFAQLATENFRPKD